MKEKIFKDKITIDNDIRVLQDAIKAYQAELDLLKCKNKILDKEIMTEFEIHLTNSYEYDNYKFVLERDVTTTILKSKREDAVKYNNKFKVGIFALTIQGMKLKAWVKDILNQNMPVPDFVSYEEFPKIRIEKLI